MASAKDQKEHQELIIIRRPEEDEHESHSSAWKVAHADFMTAMMAFFLIMWLINVTDEEVRKGISQYFNPVHITEGETQNKGLNDPKTGEKPDDKAKPGKAPPSGADEAAAPDSAPAAAEEHGAEASAAAVASAAAAAASGGAPEAMPGDPLSEVVAEGDPLTVGPAEKATMDDRERAAFQDPYALLAALAADYKAKHPASADVVVGDTRDPGLIGGEADRDPFDPIYWQMANAPDVRTGEPGEPGTNEVVLLSAEMDATAPEPASTAGDPLATEAPPDAAPRPASKSKPKPVTLPEPAIATNAESGADADTMTAAAALGDELRASLKTALGASPSPEINVTATSEGVLIDLIDDEDFSMFEIGSAIPDPKVVVILEQVATVLSGKPGNIVVRGHTDGRPFRSDTYDNWRLSAARAHMAYYMLVRGGLLESRVERIEGYADRHLKIPSDPNNAANRRIEILMRQPAP